MNAIGWAHGLVKADAPEEWGQIAGKDFDYYDAWSFLYGWIYQMQEISDVNSDGASECFFAAYSMIQTLDLWWQDIVGIEDNKNLFNILFYMPIHVLNNFGASYE